MLRIVLRG